MFYIVALPYKIFPWLTKNGPYGKLVLNARLSYIYSSCFEYKK